MYKFEKLDLDNKVKEERIIHAWFLYVAHHCNYFNSKNEKKLVSQSAAIYIKGIIMETNYFYFPLYVIQ